MKIPQKLEPYQRSRHRATLQAWVMAATAVASVGMPAAALVRSDEDQKALTCQSDLTPSQSAQRVAIDWIEALRVGDHERALTSMRLPREAGLERAVMTELDTLSELIAMPGVSLQPVAHRHAGHWALSAWRVDAPDPSSPVIDLLEPIALYNPASDDLFDVSMQWQVVPQGFADDAALAPLYNADYDALIDWYQTLA